MSLKRLYLIDASIYIFRAYFSLPDTFVDNEGNPSNAVYGFADFLARFLAQAQARYIAVAFDESLTTSFRNEFFPDYKANRELPPPELEAQLKACQDISEALGLSSFVSERYEADDLIGTLAHGMRPHGFSMIFVSGDKDLAQLIQGKDVWWDFAREHEFRAPDIRDKLGVAPNQIVDFIALTGDKVDNIPGVDGIGKKTASQLLKRFGSLDAIYARLNEVPTMKIRAAEKVRMLLADAKDSAYLSQRLARIAVDAPIDFSPATLARRSVDQAEVAALCDRFNFGEAMRKRLLNSKLQV